MVTFPTEAAVPAVLRASANRDAFDVVRQEDIDGLLGLQREHGTALVYVVNVNDTLDSQAAFVERLVAAGLEVAMLEMGNELYLPKFTRGDVTKLGVTRAWSSSQYIALLTEWGARFRLILPTVAIYGVGASHGPTQSPDDLARRRWNESLQRALATSPELIDGVTFHHYGSEQPQPSDHDRGEEPISTTDLSYLATFGALPIAMTETGYAMTDVTTADLDRAEAFWESIKSALKPGDVFGIHVMFNSMLRNDAGGSFALYDENGRTPVGDRFAQWLSTWATKSRGR